MRQTIRAWLDRLPIADPIQRRQSNVLQLFLIGWIIIAILGILPMMSGSPAPDTNTTQLLIVRLLQFAGVSLFITPIIALIFLRRGRFKRSVIVAVLGLLVSHSVATYLLGANEGSVLVVYQLPIVLAGLLGGRRLLLVAASWSLLVVAGVTILQLQSPPMAGLFTASNGGDLSTSGVTFGFFVAITLLVTLLLDRFGNTLRAALMESLDRERELQAIRASLEDTIAARTAALQSALNDVNQRMAQQQQLLEENEVQRATIQDLSVPVIPVSGDTLVMPLVGALDTNRLRLLQEQCLQALDQAKAKRLVIDITGVPIVDTQVAHGLLLTVRSARLLGAEVALVGIRPEVAQSIVGLGLDLQQIQTYSDLQSALDQKLIRSTIRPIRQVVPQL